MWRYYLCLLSSLHLEIKQKYIVNGKDKGTPPIKNVFFLELPEWECLTIYKCHKASWQALTPSLTQANAYLNVLVCTKKHRPAEFDLHRSNRTKPYY